MPLQATVTMLEREMPDAMLERQIVLKETERGQTSVKQLPSKFLNCEVP